MSFGLPLKTDYGRVVTKKKLFAMGISASRRSYFTQIVKSIRWQNKLAASLLNVKEGTKVVEVEAFELELHPEKKENVQVLLEIDRLFPYHFIFVFSQGDRVQAWVSNKEVLKGGKIRALKSSDYIHTPWMAREELKFTIEGFTMDEVYESLVRQIAALAGYEWQEGLSIAANLEREDVRTKLARQIAALMREAAQTKQFNRQIELRDQVHELQEEYNNLK